MGRRGWERFPGGGHLGWAGRMKLALHPHLCPITPLQGLCLPAQVCLDPDTAQRRVNFNAAVWHGPHP